MSMTSAQLPTLTNTPREQAAIAAMGVFGHRKLAEALNAEGIPLWTTEMEKSAFITADAQERAQRLLVALQQFDAKVGGAPPQVAPVPVAMAAQPPQAELPPREPINNGKKTNGKSGSKAAGAPTAMSADLTPVIERLDAIGKMSRAEFEEMKKQNANQQQQILALQQMVSAQYKIMQVMLGVLANFGQEVLKAPSQMILEDSVTTGAEALVFLESLGKGQGQG